MIIYPVLLGLIGITFLSCGLIVYIKNRKIKLETMLDDFNLKLITQQEKKNVGFRTICFGILLICMSILVKISTC